MARQIIDVNPTITLRPELYGTGDQRRAQRVADEIVALIMRHVSPTIRDAGGDVRSFGAHDVEITFEEDARCGHCGQRWTEVSPDYNGGCCGEDAANDPELLAGAGAA